MYNFLFDSDAIIKLAHSGALAKLCESFNCITTKEVQEETVDEGKKRLYPDAEMVEALIKEGLLKIKNSKKTHQQPNNLGEGELSVLSLSKEIKNYIIATDDQTFIKELEKERIEFIVPSDLILLLKRLKKASKSEAREYLENMKVFIREEDYKQIKLELEE